MAEPKTRKLTKPELAAGVSALAAEHRALTARVKELEAELRTARTLAVTASGQLADSRAFMTRVNSRAAKLKEWAEQYAKGNTVVPMVIDELLHVPNGNVSPFARWNYPGLELIR